MNKQDKTICFTGHRELNAPAAEIKKELKKTIIPLIDKVYMYFGAGGARGFDMLAEESIIELRSFYKHIKLILVLPFDNQYINETGWSREEISRYAMIKQKADKVVIVEPRYSNGCYYRRNKHLVDNAGLCVSYQYKDTGGTAYTVQYAKSQNVKVVNISV